MKCFLKVLVSAILLIPFIILMLVGAYIGVVTTLIYLPFYLSGCYDGEVPLITIMDFLYNLTESWRKL